MPFEEPMAHLSLDRSGDTHLSEQFGFDPDRIARVSWGTKHMLVLAITSQMASAPAVSSFAV
jgi:hypothetical protein